jgi:hypothetical protein
MNTVDLVIVIQYRYLSSFALHTKFDIYTVNRTVRFVGTCTFSLSLCFSFILFFSNVFTDVFENEWKNNVSIGPKTSI